MGKSSNQLQFELLLKTFMETCIANDPKGIVSTFFTPEEIPKLTLDPENLLKTAVYTKQPDVKFFAATITYDGWTIWVYSNVAGLPISADFTTNNPIEEVKRVAMLYLDLVYRRIATVVYISDTKGSGMVDIAGRPLEELIKVVQFYIKEDGIYKLLVTTYPWSDWKMEVLPDGRERLYEQLKTHKLVIADIEEGAGLPLASSIELLEEARFPWKLGIKEGDVKSLNDLEPLNQEVGFISGSRQDY